jgi:hypothetical protein
MKTPPSPDPLSRTLADWRVAPRPHPQFRAAVWARIDTARGAASWSSFTRAHLAAVAGAVAIAILAGAVTGRERARARVETERGQLANAYVQAMDARTMRMP